MTLVQRLYSGNPGFDLRKVWPKMVVVSAAAVLVCLGSLAVRGLHLGIDFEGGAVWEVETDDLSIEDVRDALRPVGQDGARIQVLTSGSGVRTIRVQAGVEAVDANEEVVDALADAAGVDAGQVSINTVGPSWGDEITAEAQRALVFFFVAIALYISVRLEWRMAVGALVAVVHDIIITIGVYSIFRFEVTPATVIAFLTILGYSLYDTVVVFDKLREMRPLVGVRNRLTYTDMANHASNEVLMRSVNTSLTSLLPVLSLLVVGSWIMGAATLEEFAIALAVGLLVGAYSSLFVAVPAVLFLKERQPEIRDVREQLGGHQDDAAAVVAAAEAAALRDERGTPAAAKGPVGRSESGERPRPAPRVATPTATHPPRPRKKGKKR
ncbi:protein translocase subunit SecF [Actinomarinicola tropica]|uniref:Protein-export membrane protein SecF n=1 Tax=Actinomarinicola tropica TaxID=2789776 RepID=A0A5Q2RL47_9ACTN|nr:protein translocase subunit SecF [Actinomarinicola tropica]QGG95156.1 protein translocase subunit SecF [Actinomarinicola tropica]